MRKAAIIIGIICAVLAVVAFVLKVIHFPGGSILFVLVTGLYCTVALSLWLIPQFRENKNRKRRAAIVFTWYGVSNLLISVLYHIQHWPRSFTPTVTGAIFALLAFVFYILSAKKENATTKWFSTFTFASLIVFGSMSVAWALNRPMSERITEAMNHYEAQEQRRSEGLDLCDSELVSFTQEPWSGFYHEALLYYNEGLTLVNKIEALKREMVALSNDVDHVDSISVDLIQHPDDYDTPAYYMIGPDNQSPTGKAVELFQLLKEFAKLSGDRFSVSFGITSEDYDSGTWTRNYFYNRPLIEVLDQLTSFQQSILYTVQSNLNMKRFGSLKQ